MDCAAILDLLSEYIDGTLDVQTRTAVEKHIAVCENCKQELASLRAIVDELR
ncbi:MAG: zf-HC2 domain-containing protein, partial [Deltaproteobacteria bacterium]|nr:zf-HC2 domain-containing protein [Deltaproteobacteria bacterium]